MFGFLKRGREYRIAEAKLKEAIALCTPLFEEAGLSERIRFISECVDHNESGVALEILCDNLHEFGLPVASETIELIRKPEGA